MTLLRLTVCYGQGVEIRDFLRGADVFLKSDYNQHKKPSVEM